MLPLLSCLSLLSFALVVSQPLFYWMALDRATQALSARAYAELWQPIIAALVKRLVVTYLLALLLLLTLLATALLQSRSAIALGAGIAALSLIADLALSAPASQGVAPTYLDRDAEERRTRGSIASARGAVGCERGRDSAF